MSILSLFYFYSAFLLRNAIVAASLPNPTANYANKLILAEPDLYILYWNYTDQDILFEVHAKTKGWIGFGLSPNGDMLNSDIVISWVNLNGSTHFSDRNTQTSRTLNIDKQQNWFPLLVTLRDGFTVAKFTRKIKLCDSTTSDDMNVESGTPFVIYAWGETIVEKDAFYHGTLNRGSKTVPLITTLNTKVNVNMDKVTITDFRVKVK